MAIPISSWCIGMRVNALAGLKTLFGFGPKIDSSHKAIYDDMRAPIGMLKFAPAVNARGGMFSARKRSLLTPTAR